MSAILGMRGTGTWSSDQRPTNFREKILYEYPNAPNVLTMLLGMLKNEKTDDPKFTVFTKSLPDQTAFLDGNLADATHTTLDLDTTPTGYPADSYPGRKFKNGSIVMNERTGEVMFVTSRTDTVLTVVRNWGPIAPAVIGTGIAMLDQDRLTVVGSAYPEGADYPTSISFDPTTSYNYTQIFRTSLILTGTAAETYYRTGDINAEQKFEKAIQHGMEMEKAFLYGTRYEAADPAGGGQLVRTTGGVKYWIDNAAASEQNIGAFSSTGLTKAGWNEFLRGIYTVPGGSQNKVALVGATALGVLNDYAEANAHINLEPKDSTYGLTIRTLYHAWGELKLIHHPLMSENPAWTKDMFIIDTRNIIYRFMSNRDTKFLKNRQGNGEDLVAHEFMTDAGLELQHVRTHGYATGIEEYIP